MIILILDATGEALDLGAQLETEGHEVLHFIGDDNALQVGEGILTQPAISTYGRYLRHVDMILAATPGFGATIAQLKNKGFMALGASPGTDRLVYDLEFMYDIAGSVRIRTPRWKSFRVIDMDGAIKYAKRFEPLEFRSHGVDYISKDRHDMIQFLEYVARGAPGIGDTIMLQESITGYPAVVGSWFNGHVFVRPIFQGFPADDKAMVGQFVVKSKLFGTTMTKLTAFLKSIGFVGYIEGSFLISEGKPYLYGIDTGCIIPSTLVQQELIREGMGSFLQRLFEGKTKSIRTFTRFGCGLSVGTALRHKDNLPIELPEDMKHFHLGHLKRLDNGFFCTGYLPAIVAAGHAKEVPVAIQRAKDMVKNISLPAMDVDHSITGITGYDQLVEWGYL